MADDLQMQNQAQASEPCSKALNTKYTAWHVSLYLTQEDVGGQQVGLELVRDDAQHISDLELGRLQAPGQVVGGGQQQVRLQEPRTVLRHIAQQSAGRGA